MRITILSQYTMARYRALMSRERLSCPHLPILLSMNAFICPHVRHLYRLYFSINKYSCILLESTSVLLSTCVLLLSLVGSPGAPIGHNLVFTIITS